MNESQVWQSVVSYLDEQGIPIFCGCPPGATCYRFSNCSLFDGAKSDAPDLIFSYKDAVVFCECKPTFQGIQTPFGGESDIEKLERMLRNAHRGLYNRQLTDNFGIQTSDRTRFIGALAYFGAQVEERNYLHLAMQPDGKIHFVDLT